MDSEQRDSDELKDPTEGPVELGPFTEFDLKGMVEILEDKRVNFEIIQDEDLYETQKKEHDEKMIGRSAVASNRFLPAYLFLEIDATDLPKVRTYLAKYLGVV